MEIHSELKERTATLNTQLRFGRERQALQEAYKLRAYIQLRGARLEDEQRELQRVEKVIAELETRKMSGIQRLIKTLIDTAKASLNPEVYDETTLLDQFKYSPRITTTDLDDAEDLPPEDEFEHGLFPPMTEAEAGQLPPTTNPTTYWGSEGYSYDDKF